MPHHLWDEQPAVIKTSLHERILHEFGALHGQVVVCEARLNMDYDRACNSINGPWPDGIPLDGRDIWRFQLVMADIKQIIWVLDVNSLTNLGRDTGHARS